MTEKYPDIPDDVDSPPSNIVRELSEWDELHSAKAAILATMAKTEFHHAKAENEPGMGQFNHEDGYTEFLRHTDEIMEELLD